MSRLKVVFALYHIYDKCIDDITFRESKRIGFFETKRQCIEIIDVYKNSKGFIDHPEICFKILEYEIGKQYWRAEFLL